MSEGCGFEFLMNSGIAQRMNTLSEYILKNLGDSWRPLRESSEKFINLPSWLPFNHLSCSVFMSQYSTRRNNLHG